jgi:hypothetical protein
MTLKRVTSYDPLFSFFSLVNRKSALLILLLREILQGEPDSLDHRVRCATGPDGPTPWTSLTGAVAAPVRFATSPRLPSNKLEKHGSRLLMA